MKYRLIAIAVGIFLTILLTTFGLYQSSRADLCIYIWQACLVQLVVKTPANDINEGSPIDLFGFALGVLAGVPIYSIFTYALLRFYARFLKKKTRA